MTRRPAIKGTPEERRAARAQRRQINRSEYVRSRAQATRSGRERLVIACNAALAVGKRMTEEGRHDLARAIAELVQKADVAATRKEWP